MEGYSVVKMQIGLVVGAFSLRGLLPFGLDAQEPVPVSPELSWGPCLHFGSL